MSKKYFIKLFAIMIVIIYGGLCLTTANASYPVLKLDFSNSTTPAQLEPGFYAFTLPDSGSTIKSITISLAPIEPDPPIPGKPAVIDSRWRWAPTGIPYELVYRDFLFSRPGGIEITLSGLWPNEAYEITIWAFDVGSATIDRIADWYANGEFCLTTNFIGTTPPTDANSHAFTGTADSDANGTIVLGAYPNPNHGEQSGENNPYAFINALVIASVAPITDATNPTPEDGTTVAATQVDLSWIAGMFAASHNVYFGETFEDVNDANTLDTEYRGSTDNNSFSVGSAGQPYPTGLPADKTYYWRIDEVNEPNVWTGKVWSFYVPPKTAYNPSPVDGSLFADSNFLDPEVILSWYQAADANSYDVYFGTNFNDVNQGTGGTDQGTVTDPNYDLNMMLEFQKTYYWRVDANDGTTTYPGAVWSFKTSPSSLGTIDMDIWEDIDGSTLDLLTDDVRYPDSPTRTEELTSFDSGDSIGDNYGGRIHGLVYVPLTGDYTFYFTSADQGQLWLSSDDDPANLIDADPNTPELDPLAMEYVWGSYNAFTHWSDPIPLIGGNKYYIMAIWKEGIDWDHCQVAWQGAGIRDQQIIRGCYLSPLVRSKSYNPYPPNGAIDVESKLILRWQPGVYADKHDVYFGTDFNSVNDANRAEHPGLLYYSENQDANYYPENGTLDLDLGQTYYWRIDDVNDACAPGLWRGGVWNFTVAEYLIVEDFDSYVDTDALATVWKDYWTNGTSAEVYVETDPNLVQDGNSMRYWYRNNGSPYYSEAEADTADLPSSTIGSDWTAGDVKALVLYFYGQSGNDANEQMYVALSDGSNEGVVTYGGYGEDLNDLRVEQWQEWNIDLEDFNSAGVDLTNITRITIGFGDGSKGGEGTVYFDDIRLYKPRCVLLKRSADFAKVDYAPAGDPAGDCRVDYQEMLLMADDWLFGAVPSTAEEIWREAESADTITAPMQVWSDMADASGGQYVAVVPDNNSIDNPPDPNGVATYDFTVEGGTYRILGRVIAPTFDDDSFWVQIPGATTQTNNHESGWVQWNNIAGGADWHWDVVHSSDDEYTEVEWTMAAGTYTLKVAYREDGTLLDMLLITDDLDLDEADFPPWAADINIDDRVDFKDFALLAKQWLEEVQWP